MNNKGFSLVELLGCLVLLGVILGIGLYSSRGTLSTSLTIFDQVSENEIYDAAEIYLLENGGKWINNGEEYSCVKVSSLVDMGYFEYGEITNYSDKYVKVVRDSITRVISDRELVDECE